MYINILLYCYSNQPYASSNFYRESFFEAMSDIQDIPRSSKSHIIQKPHNVYIYMFIVAHHVRILHTSNTLSDTNIIIGYYINMHTVIRMLLTYTYITSILFDYHI